MLVGAWCHAAGVSASDAERIAAALKEEYARSWSLPALVDGYEIRWLEVRAGVPAPEAIEEFRLRTAGKPDHPDRGELAILNDRLRNGPERVEYRFVAGAGSSRLTIMHPGRLEPEVYGRNANDQWSLYGAKVGTKIRHDQPPPAHGNYKAVSDTVLNWYGPLLMGRVPQLSTDVVFADVRATGAGLFEATAAVPGAVVAKWVLRGRWDRVADRVLLERATPVYARRDAGQASDEISFADWKAVGPDGRLVPTRVHVAAHWIVAGDVTWVSCKAVDTATVSALAATPMRGTDDPDVGSLAGLAQLDLGVEAQRRPYEAHGGEGLVPFPAKPNQAAPADPVAAYLGVPGTAAVWWQRPGTLLALVAIGTVSSILAWRVKAWFKTT